MYSCLSKVPIFQHLSQADMKRVHEFIQPAHFQKGESIQLADHYVPKLLVLNRGQAKVSRTDEQGNEQVIRILKPGDYIGETAVFGDEPVQYDTFALENSSFCSLDKTHLHELLKAQPDLALKILGDLSQRLQSAEAQLESLGQKPAEQRLLDTLREHAEGKPMFTLRISKKDLAGQIGVRPETLSRLLKRVHGQGLVKVEGRQVRFLK